MRIGIDARMMDSTFGLGRYVQQLIKHLAQSGQGHQYVLFTRSKEQEEKNKHQLGILPDNFRVVYADIPWYGWKEQLYLPSVLQKEKLDLMHFPHWNVPLLYRGPFVVTIHDLTMFHFPRPEATTLGPVFYWIKDKISRIVIRSALRRAQHIISTTEYTKHDVQKTFRLKKQNMTTIYQAPFVKEDSRLQSADVRQEKKEKKSVLYVGAAYPHKNLHGLLKAWKRFESAYESDATLLLAGRQDAFYDRLVQSDDFASCERVRYLGTVTDKQLEELYRQATLYIFPSLYEGFGLPPLEAMAHNVPVVSSDRSCLPEVLGDAALYVDPENVAQCAETMHRALTDENTRYELQTNACEHLKIYSWKKLAQETQHIYESALLRTE